MKALTLAPVWAWAVLHLGKNVENRTWKPFKGLDRFLLHAGTRTSFAADATACGDAARRAGWRIHAMDGGLMFIKGDEHRFLDPKTVPQGVILAEMQLKGWETDSASPWAYPREVHWLVEVRKVLDTPVRCKGALQLWECEGMALSQVRAQLMKD